MPLVFIFMQTVFLLLLIFSPLFLRALYILFVIWVANIFFGWSYMFSFTDGDVFCPLKIFLILCNHFYLFVYSLCIWVRVRKTLPFSSFKFRLVLLWLCFSIYIFVRLMFIQGMLWDLVPTLWFSNIQLSKHHLLKSLYFFHSIIMSTLSYI